MVFGMNGLGFSQESPISKNKGETFIREETEAKEEMDSNPLEKNYESDLTANYEGITLPQTENSGRALWSERKLSSKTIECKLEKMNSFFSSQNKSFALQNTISIKDPFSSSLDQNSQPSILFKSSQYSRRKVTIPFNSSRISQAANAKELHV